MSRKLELPLLFCWLCEKVIIPKVNRDLKRKKYCSHACRQKMRYLRGEVDMKRVRQNCYTPEANAKKGQRGSEHSRYKIDRTTIKSPRPRYELTAWRKAVFARDNYTCQQCRVRGGKIQAHHIKSYTAFPELRWKLDNGETLCEKCHKKTPNYGAKAMKENRHAISVC